MANFGTVERERQARFREKSPTISKQGRSQSDDRCWSVDYLLHPGYEEENLYPSIRGTDGARKFFTERGIKWWSAAASCDTGWDGPTRNMASSQIMCVNFMLPLAEIDGALAAALRAIDDDVESVVDIVHDGRKAPAELEWIGVPKGLDGNSRGSLTTSVDAFVIAETSAGQRRAYLIEWKYVENYSRKFKDVGRNRKTYSSLYSSSFKDAVPMDELLHDPFRQLLRIRLLGDRMVAEGELEVSDAKVVVAVPEGNTGYREKITSSPLAKRFPDLNTVSEVFSATLEDPDRKFTSVSPSTLLKAVERECGGDEKVSDWSKYMRERYGL